MLLEDNLSLKERNNAIIDDLSKVIAQLKAVNEMYGADKQALQTNKLDAHKLVIAEFDKHGFSYDEKLVSLGTRLVHSKGVKVFNATCRNISKRLNDPKADINNEQRYISKSLANAFDD